MRFRQLPGKLDPPRDPSPRPYRENVHAAIESPTSTPQSLIARQGSQRVGMVGRCHSGDHLFARVTRITFFAMSLIKITINASNLDTPVLNKFVRSHDLDREQWVC